MTGGKCSTLLIKTRILFSTIATSSPQKNNKILWKLFGGLKNYQNLYCIQLAH